MSNRPENLKVEVRYEKVKVGDEIEGEGARLVLVDPVHGGVWAIIPGPADDDQGREFADRLALAWNRLGKNWK